MSQSFSSSSSNNNNHQNNQPILPLNPLALAEYQHRLQLFDYAQQAAALRMRLNHAAVMNNLVSPASSSGPASSPSTPVFGLSPHPALEAAAFPPLNPFARFDPRFRFMHEEPKPQHSYIGLIAMAILSTPDHKMVLSDIYQYILDNYPYFRNRGPGWRNSIRHNLSLNDCFVKSGRSANGKGHYWAIHPANVDDFMKGDFRRRKAQRKVRRHMGLSVPDDEDSNSPTPTPMPASGPLLQFPHHHHPLVPGQNIPMNEFPMSFMSRPPMSMQTDFLDRLNSNNSVNRAAAKRLFDVESLLAPDSTTSMEKKASSMAHELKQHSSSQNRSSSPRNTSTPSDFVCKTSHTESNCSSPSVSSSKSASPQPTTVSKESSSSTSDSSPVLQYGNHVDLPGQALTPWQVAQIQSLHSLQQFNAGLIRHRQGFSSENNPLSVWAAMSALASSQQQHNHHSHQPHDLLSSASSKSSLSGIQNNHK
jgi:hypothetical protein